MKASIDRLARILLALSTIAALGTSTLKLGNEALFVAVAAGLGVSALIGGLAWTREDLEVRRGKSQAERCDDRAN